MMRSAGDPQDRSREVVRVTGYEASLTTFLNYLKKELFNEDNFKEVIQIKG